MMTRMNISYLSMIETLIMISMSKWFMLNSL